ncbi:LRR domain containing protein [Trema orientale]|uniref:LRR domain containing protein n=1 Tax=Trema orientale TaxID=63057 RepID=A0A2P5F935_TREOI|nr:LRR domain containing protein [Trema orientale]
MLNNALTGKIPSSIGNMRVLESLDLSKNNLSEALAGSFQQLSFLSFLNVSFNQIVGRIPAPLSPRLFRLIRTRVMKDYLDSHWRKDAETTTTWSHQERAIQNLGQ